MPDVVDLISIELINGQTINALYGGQKDVVVGIAPTTYYATKYGSWARGKITTEASFDPISHDMDLTFTDVDAEAGGPVMFPGGNITLLQAVFAGLMEGSRVTIFTAYMPTYGDTSLGLETKFLGDILGVKSCTRMQAVFTCRDPLWQLTQNTPPNIYQSSCHHSLFNPNCTLSKAAFTVTGTVAAGSTNMLINLTAALGSVGNDSLPYTQGVITFTSGNNKGLSQSIRKQNSTTQLQLDVPMFMTVNIGDTFKLVPGCNKLEATCDLKFNNKANFPGKPFTPQPEQIL